MKIGKGAAQTGNGGCLPVKVHVTLFEICLI